MPVLTVAVLGRVVVRRDGVAAAVPTGRTTELLVRLALEGERPVRAQRLAEDLWPGGARANTLQVKVSQLRRALGDAAAVPGGPAGYALVADTVDALDATRLAAEGAARLADGDPAAAATACRAGLRLFDTEVLPAAGDGDWVAPHRMRLTEVRLRLTEDELAARLALGAAGELVGELEALVAEHPLREGLWALLVKALYRAGRPADALAAHRRVSRMLAEELGVDPGPALAGLAHQVLVHDPALGGPPRGNLPAPTTPLVGRAAELAAVRGGARRAPARDGRRARAGWARPGSPSRPRAGDQRRTARGWSGSRACATADELPTALAEALPGRAGVAGLRGADLLLVLDNCEHLVDAVGDAVTQVLDAAPGVRVLATSQRALGVDGRADLPAGAARRRRRRRPVHRAAPTAAAAAGPDVLPLCRALDGLPLAIELAAARTRVLNVPEILRRLDDRFALLADPAARGPERRRTLARSAGLELRPALPRRPARAVGARGVPRRCVARRAGARARRVGRPAGGRARRRRTAGGPLARPGRRAPDGHPLPAPRQRARVRPGAGRRRTRRAAPEGSGAVLDGRSGAVATTDTALVDWVAGLAARVGAGVRGPEQAALVATTAAERATIDTALALADGEVAADIATGFGWAWVLLDDAGAAARLRPFADRADAGLLLSFVDAMSGDLLAARAAFDGVRGGDPDRVRWFGGFLLTQEGRYAEAAADLERCHTAFGARGEDWWAGGSLLLAAFARLGLGDVAAAAAACAAAIQVLEPLERRLGPAARRGGAGPDRARDRPLRRRRPPPHPGSRGDRAPRLPRGAPPCTSCTWPRPSSRPTTRPPPRRWNARPRAQNVRVTDAS